jgi:hypothetical protein
MELNYPAHPIVEPDPSELPPRLRCSNGNLIKPNGNPIILKGTCYGSWGEDDALDATPIRALGANCLRICLRWHGQWGRAEVDCRDDVGFALLSRPHLQRWFEQIESAVAAGMWVIPFIDSNCGQSGRQNADMVRYCDPYGSWGAAGRNFYTDASLRKIFAEIVWPTVAARLRTIAKIAMLEIHPEPAIGCGPEYAPLVAQVQRECIEAIRKVDRDTPILLGPRDAYQIDYCDEAWLQERDDVVYTGNLLSHRVINPAKFDAGLAKLVEMRERRLVPIHVQQLGRRTVDDPTLSHLRRALTRLEHEAVGYSHWQWKQNTSDPGEYALNYKSADDPDVWVQKADEVALLQEFWQ